MFSMFGDGLVMDGDHRLPADAGRRTSAISMGSAAQKLEMRAIA